jgi:hypothetical protein
MVGHKENGVKGHRDTCAEGGTGAMPGKPRLPWACSPAATPRFPFPARGRGRKGKGSGSPAGGKGGQITYAAERPPLVTIFAGLVPPLMFLGDRDEQKRSRPERSDRHQRAMSDPA